MMEVSNSHDDSTCSCAWSNNDFLDTKCACPQHERSPAAQFGDIVTINLELKPENGFVPEPLFDTTGQVTFVLGKGNYLPGLHTLLMGMKVGDKVSHVSIDAGWGSRNSDLIIDVPKSNFQKVESIDSIKVGSILNLKGGVQVRVIGVNDDTIVVDANHPFAGSSYACSVTVMSIDPFPKDKVLYHEKNEEETCSSTNDDGSSSLSSKYEVATWALGCFWGGELAFMRVPGVVGTRVGYTQGTKVNPTYEDVTSGTTQHREAIMIIFDPSVVSYKQLTAIYMERLAATASQYKIDLFREEYSSMQYQHGIYYHNEEQRAIAESVIQEKNNFYQVELKKATEFYNAEEYHQQYLLKGGQSARKNARATIRCFG